MHFEILLSEEIDENKEAETSTSEETQADHTC